MSACILLLFLLGQMLTFAQGDDVTSSAPTVCNALQARHLNLGCCGDSGQSAVCVAPTMQKPTRRTQIAQYNTLASIRASIDHAQIKQVTTTYGNNESYKCTVSSIWFHSDHIVIECQNAYKIIAFQNGTTVERWKAEDGTVVTYTLISPLSRNRRTTARTATKGKIGGFYCEGPDYLNMEPQSLISLDGTTFCAFFEYGEQEQ